VDDGAEVSRVSFARISGAPPPAREILEVEADGSWTAERATGRAVGRFAGPADEAGGVGARIVELADAAAENEPPGIGDQRVDATVDRVTVGERSLVAEYRSDPGGPWGELLRSCRALLEEAIDHPVAAIAMNIAGPGVLRLEHRGSEPVRLDLGGARAEGTVWTEAGEFLTRGKGRLDLGPVEAGPGWTQDIVLEGLDPEADGNLVAIVRFAIESGGTLVPAALSAGRAPG